MYTGQVGVSILTSGDRRGNLELCLSSLLCGCAYRPLAIAIYDNGSTDDTMDYLSHGLPEVHGVEWRVGHSDKDGGCSHGTNQAMAMVSGLEYALHLESDFHHGTERQTGVDRNWMRRAIDFMEMGGCDYIYLRRMRNETEMMMHFWSQWMPRITEERWEFMRCTGFWWSQNPHLRRNPALLASGTIPVPELESDHKGSPAWNKSEMATKAPPNAWLHKWGFFFHGDPDMPIPAGLSGCGDSGPFGLSTCKYGFYRPGPTWCRECRHVGFRDMANHEARMRESIMQGGLK